MKLIYFFKKKIFEIISKVLNLSIDDFIRTTEQRHHDSVKAIWNKK